MIANDIRKLAVHQDYRSVRQMISSLSCRARNSPDQIHSISVSVKANKICPYVIQSNIFNMDTKGTWTSVRITEVEFIFMNLGLFRHK